jgi:hypothetical protein
MLALSAAPPHHTSQMHASHHTALLVIDSEAEQKKSPCCRGSTICHLPAGCACSPISYFFKEKKLSNRRRLETIARCTAVAELAYYYPIYSIVGGRFYRLYKNKAEQRKLWSEQAGRPSTLQCAETSNSLLIEQEMMEHSLYYYYCRSWLLVCSSVLALCLGSRGQLTPGFYRSTCPQLYYTVQRHVFDAMRAEARMGASLLRLHFHDCFVNVIVIYI